MTLSKKYSIWIILVFIAITGYSQEIFPGKNEIKKHNISGMITRSFSGMGEKGKKLYTDTITFNKAGLLIEKRITVYDTSLKESLSGKWKYTYDSLGNLLGETRKSQHENSMDYYNLVYDSLRIIKKIWVYWINMKHQFDRIYEYTYDKTENHLLQSTLVEDGTEKIDSVYSYKYDDKNRLVNVFCSGDKTRKDTILTISYSYDTNNRLIKKESGNETIIFTYDREGLMDKTQRFKTRSKIPFNTTFYFYAFRQDDGVKN